MALRKEATIVETGRALKSHSITTSAGRGRLSLPWQSGQCNRPVYSQRRGACRPQRAISRTVHVAQAELHEPSFLKSMSPRNASWLKHQAVTRTSHEAHAELQPLLACLAQACPSSLVPLADTAHLMRPPQPP